MHAAQVGTLTDVSLYCDKIIHVYPRPIQWTTSQKHAGVPCPGVELFDDLIGVRIHLTPILVNPHISRGEESPGGVQMTGT